MPRGADLFQKKAERQASGHSTEKIYPKIDYFTLGSGERAQIRFLEQGEDLAWASCHRIMVAGNRYPKNIPCLDQNDEGAPCPACVHDDKNIRSRSVRGFVNAIWRGNEDLQESIEKLPANMKLTLAPVYKRNQYGSPEKGPDNKKIITGFADSVFLWECSKTVFQELLSKDSAYKGLMSRDFIISRQGASKEDTRYFIEPADVDAGPQPMMVADMSLMNGKFDIDALTKPPSFEEMTQMLSADQTPYESYENQVVKKLEENDDVFSGQAPMRSSAFNR